MTRTLFSLLLLSGAAIFSSFAVWQKDFDTARRIATEKNQLILLNFSGSDWCGPCIRMHKEIFADQGFSGMADTSLVLLNADFPRAKKNQLSKEQQNANELLAEKYNRDGKFPYTVLLDEEGKVLQAWEGLPSSDPSQFTLAIKKICDEQKQ